MATWNRLVNSSSAGNVKLNIDYAVTNVNRSGNTVTFNYGIRFSMASSTYTYNNIAAFCPSGGTKYYAFGGNGKSHTDKGTYYYARSTSVSTTTGETTPFYFSQNVSSSATSLTFSVGFGWDAWNPSQKGTANITVSFPAAPPPEPEPTPDPTPTPPGAASLSLSSASTNSITLRYASSDSTVSQIRIYKDGSLWDTRNATSNGYVAVTGLETKTTYSFQVQVYSSASGLWSSMSNTVTATTNPETPVVSGVYVSSLSPHSATINITASSLGDTEYYCFTLCNSYGTEIRSEVQRTTNYYTFSSLSDETSYKVKTRLIAKESGESSGYTTVSFTTPPDVGKAYIKADGYWRYGNVYIKRNGSWIRSKGAYVKRNNSWYKGT